MEWLVDDFLVDPSTSSFLQNEATARENSKKKRAISTTADQGTGGPGQQQTLPATAEHEEEEELLHEDQRRVSISSKSKAATTLLLPHKTTAPGRLKRKATPAPAPASAPVWSDTPRVTITSHPVPPTSGGSAAPGRLRRRTLSHEDSSSDDDDHEDDAVAMVDTRSHIDEQTLAASSDQPSLLVTEDAACDQQISLTAEDRSAQQRQSHISSESIGIEGIDNGINSCPSEAALYRQSQPTSTSRLAIDDRHTQNEQGATLSSSHADSVVDAAGAKAETNSRSIPFRKADPPATCSVKVAASSSLDNMERQSSSSSSASLHQSTSIDQQDNISASSSRAAAAPTSAGNIPVTATSTARMERQLSVDSKPKSIGETPRHDSLESSSTCVSMSHAEYLSVQSPSVAPSNTQLDPADQLASNYIQQMLSSPPPDSLSPVSEQALQPASHDLAGSIPGERPPRREMSDSTVASEGNGSSEKASPASITASVPRLVEILTEYEPGEVITSWRANGRLFESDMNRRGVFHVRVLRAQRLSCPVGSKVHAVVSLNPWKGKVRTDKAIAFSHKSHRRGVCAQWDVEASPVTVTHAYSSEESPVPSLQVDVLFNPIGVFDVNICSVAILCHGLLSMPLMHRRQWFSTNGTDDGQAAMVEIEGMFEPAAGGDEWQSCGMSATGTLPDSIPKVCDKASSGLDDCSQSDVSISLQSASRLDAGTSTRPHLLRMYLHWKPATCCVCRRSITIGLRRRSAFRCEVCSIDCCADCQLQVDVKLPCGSDTADQARKKAIQNRFTVDNILNTVAPMNDSQCSMQSASMHSRNIGLARRPDTDTDDHNTGKPNLGIGTISFSLLRACVLADSLPPHADISSLLDKQNASFRKGDYYVRLTSSDNVHTKRTPTVQSTTRPKFPSSELEFSVSHYGTEFLIEMVDASTDKPVGATLITTQCLLQMQRDALAERSLFSFASTVFGRMTCQPLHLELALRSGIKKGFGYGFFSDRKDALNSEQPMPGTVTGVIELQVQMVEDFTSLFGREPYPCPPRPPEQLDIALFQLHVARVANIIRDIQEAVDWYKFIISWRNPFLTGLSLVVYIRFWSAFDMTKIGCLPCSMLVVFMLYLAVARRYGRLKERILKRAMDDKGKAEDIAVDYSLHRPTGLLRVNVSEGRNLRSELGLPGKVSCVVYWDAIRFANDKEKKDLGRIDKASQSTHQIATTPFSFGMTPKWENLSESTLTKRLMQLLPNQTGDEFFQCDVDHAEAAFPVLQPFRHIGDGLLVLEPWHTSVAAVVAEIRFIDTVSLLPGTGYVLGEVAIPFARLVERSEISGWFDIAERKSVSLRDGPEYCDDCSREQTVTAGAPQIFLTLKWLGPNGDADSDSENAREAAIVIQEELMRSSSIAKSEKIGLIGNSVGAISSVIGISEQLVLVQNILGSALDAIGAMRSLFNFADPRKSGILLGVVTIASLIFAVVPGRLLILVGGVIQYAITFWTRFAHFLAGKQELTNHRAQPTVIEVPSPPANLCLTWIMNAFRGLPTDEDVRKTYFWESRRKQEELLAGRASAKRTARLSRLWRAQWYSQVLIVRQVDNKAAYKRKVFAMIQGRRFLWWPSVDDFDNGEKYAGQIYLAGHAGLATPSPIEMRALEREDFNRMVCIFGCQEKITLVAPSEKCKETLELAVQFATSCKQD